MQLLPCEKINPTLTDANRNETTPISDLNRISTDKYNNSESEKQENKPKFRVVYHGSGAEFDKLIKMSYANLKSGKAKAAVGEGGRFSAKKKKGLETVSASREKHHPTAVSSPDGASKTALPEDESSFKGTVVSDAFPH